MSGKNWVAPSLLGMDLMNLESEVKSLEEAGADWHHIDVMDGHFVPNLTFGLPVIEKLKKLANKPLDVHIMISNPDNMADEYLAAGADTLVFHIEAAIHHHRILTETKKKGALCGVAVNPGTSLEEVKTLLPYLDIINLMSVNPGFCGQSYIQEVEERVATLDRFLKDLNRRDQVLIEVDGCVDNANARQLRELGADVLVSGSYIAKAADRRTAINSLRV